MAWEVVQQHEQAERVSAALIGIPAEYREAVVLRFQEGLALEDCHGDRGAPGHGKVAAISRIKHVDVAAEGSAGMTRDAHYEARELIAVGNGLRIRSRPGCGPTSMNVKHAVITSKQRTA